MFFNSPTKQIFPQMEFLASSLITATFLYSHQLPISSNMQVTQIHQPYPTLWKKAIVTPIPKSETTTLASNYRPISLTAPFLSLLKKDSLWWPLRLLNLTTLNVLPSHYDFRSDSL